MEFTKEKMAKMNKILFVVVMVVVLVGLYIILRHPLEDKLETPNDWNPGFPKAEIIYQESLKIFEDYDKTISNYSYLLILGNLILLVRRREEPEKCTGYYLSAILALLAVACGITSIDYLMDDYFLIGQRLLTEKGLIKVFSEHRNSGLNFFCWSVVLSTLHVLSFVVKDGFRKNKNCS